MSTRLSANHVKKLEAQGRIKIEPDIPADEDFHFEFQSPIPPSVNAYLKHARNGGVFKTKAAKAFQETIGKEAKAAGVRMAGGDVEIEIDYFYDPTKKRLDNDNLCKCTFDGLNLIAWIDDSQVARFVVERFPIQENEKPGLHISISRYEREFSMDALLYDED